MVAKEWGIRPSALGLCEPADDLALMLAYLDTTNLMTMYERREMEKKSKRK